MKNQLKLITNFFLTISLILSSCDQTTEKINKSFETALIPHPKEVATSDQGLALSKASKLFSSNPELQALLELFGSELQKLIGASLEITQKKDNSADIVFEIDSTLLSEEYHLEIDEIIQVTGGSYQAVAMAKTSLLQLVTQKEEFLVFPQIKIRDYPDASYRGLLIDLARTWHNVGTLKQIVDLAALYKVNYLQLHLTDDQSFTFPTEKFPKLPTPGRHYSKEELIDLVDYARVRGVTIIPEMDVPGHSRQFVTIYPEIFGADTDAENPNVINMGKEEVYQAIDEILGEIVEIFKYSPYIHTGGDEARLAQLEGDPEVTAFMETNDLGTDIHELYRYFIVRMNNMVKKYDKTMCVWEGFQREGEVEIPKDIIVFEFETNRYLPNHLVEDGYTIVNTSWKPLYVVNNGRKYTNAMWTPKTIYAWNIWRWENWWKEAPSYNPIQLKETPLIIGAQMCAWEQTEDMQIPTLRKRLPTAMERVWNTKKKVPYDEFFKSLGRTDDVLTALVGDSRQDSLLLTYDFEADCMYCPGDE